MLDALDLLADLRSSLEKLPDPGPAYDNDGQPVPNALDQASQLVDQLTELFDPDQDQTPDDARPDEASLVPQELNYDRCLADFLKAEMTIAQHLLTKALPFCEGQGAQACIQSALDVLSDTCPLHLRALLDRDVSEPVPRSLSELPEIDDSDLALALQRWKQLCSVRNSLLEASRLSLSQKAHDYIRITLDILSSELPSRLPEPSGAIS